MVERCLVKTLTSVIKTSLAADKLSDNEIAEITAEPVHVSNNRAELEHLMDILQKCDETLEQAEL